MKPEQFLKRREADWQALDSLLDRATERPETLTTSDAERLGSLYRSATSDLAIARRDFPREQVTTYLNQLVGRTHALLYTRRALSRQSVWRYFAVDIPATFRRHLRLFLIAMGLLLLPSLVAGLLTYIDPDLARFLLPAGVQSLIPQIEEQELWTDISEESRPIFSAFIATNNIQVSFLAFAGGITAGLLTIFVLVFNGLMLGGILGLTFHHGIGWGLTEFIVAHGVVELSVIGLAGAAGLLMGRALISPGAISRADALRLAAREASRLVVAAVPLLLIAGLIEGFVSPNEFIPFWVKIVVGFGYGGLMYAWLLLSGRESAQR